MGAAPRPTEGDLADQLSTTSPTHTVQAQASLRKFHPLANLFPYLTGGEFQELVEDIRRHGLIEPIDIFEDMILEGRNRYRACLAAKVEPKFKPYEGSDPIGYVISKNIRRRHLKPKEKRELIAKLIKQQPEKSSLQVSKMVGASPTTVTKVRAELVDDVSKMETSVVDTKGRKQPVKKKRRTEDDFRRDLQKAAAAMPGAMPPVIEKEVNLIITAWDHASVKKQQEFVKLRRVEIARAGEQADPFALPDFLDRRVAPG
jgi:ParB-like chromosome segregation protein Spo0J